MIDKENKKAVAAYSSSDYTYQSIGEKITDLDSLEKIGVLYEIKCPKCETVIRSLGCNIKSSYEKMIKGNGCIGCGNKELVVKRVDTKNAFEGLKK